MKWAKAVTVSALSAIIGQSTIRVSHVKMRNAQTVGLRSKELKGSEPFNYQVRYELKTPYRNGTTHVIFQPLDFIAKLAALVPKPRVNLTRFHGVFAPNSKHRVKVTPAKRGKKTQRAGSAEMDWLDKSPEERHRSMTWMQRLKRVFNIDIEVCEHCGGHVKVIASIEDPTVIAHILKHLEQKVTNTDDTKRLMLPPERAPPQAGLFDPSQSRLFD